MEYPRDTLPAVPPGTVTCGIDWANDDHAVCVTDAASTIVQRFIAEHSGKGLAGLVRRLRRAGVGEVAIERPDGQVASTLLEAGLTVVVICSNQLKNLQGRYGSAGNGAVPAACCLAVRGAAFRAIAGSARPVRRVLLGRARS